MELDDIGFLEIIEERAKNFSDKKFSYCEWIITSKCNFDCPYCNKFTNSKDLNLQEIKDITDLLKSFDVKYIHLTGGEPTVRNDLFEIVSYIKSKDIKIGISTNGSKNLEYYKELNKRGVEIFSLSLDVHDASLNKKFTNVDNVFDNVVNNIREISKIAYLTVGVVLNDNNIEHYKEIISFVSNLGVSDIRIMTATSYNKIIKFDISEDILNKHKILKYRINNFNAGMNMRGSKLSICNKCYLVWDDISLVGDYHFPCAVYAREKGSPIGKVSKNLKEERMNWFKNHDSFKDEICLKYCMDFKCRFNQTVDKYISEKEE